MLPATSALAPIGFLTLLLASAACGDPVEISTEIPPNNVPIAALRVPVIAPAGEPVDLDASASYDPDGDPLSYRFSIDGGLAATQATPLYAHEFGRSGLSTVAVEVVDLHGLRAAARHTISVRNEFPANPDFCSVPADCTVGDECDDGVCYVNGSDP